MAWRWLSAALAEAGFVFAGGVAVRYRPLLCPESPDVAGSSNGVVNGNGARGSLVRRFFMDECLGELGVLP